MTTVLKQVPFDEDLLGLVADFDCVSDPANPKPWEEEINAWIRMDPANKDGALWCQKKRKTQVWIYANENDEIVGYGSLGRTNWPDPSQGPDVPGLIKVPINLIPAVGVDRRFQGGPEGAAPEEKYSRKILRHLIREACRHTELQPFLGLYVHPENTKAIRFYESEHFLPFQQTYTDTEEGVTYVSRILSLASLDPPR